VVELDLKLSALVSDAAAINQRTIDWFERARQLGHGNKLKLVNARTMMEHEVRKSLCFL
jgi:hypothetical protein